MFNRLQQRWRLVALVAVLVAEGLSCQTSLIFQWRDFECPAGTFGAQGAVIDSSGVFLQNAFGFGPDPKSCSGNQDVAHVARCWNQTTVVNPDASAPGCIYVDSLAPDLDSCNLALDAGGVEVIFLCREGQVP